MSDRRKNQKNAKLLKEIPSVLPLLQTEAREKRVNIFLFCLLLAFGVYQAVIYWAHQPVPHFDFNCFAQTGRQILNFQPISSYKRVP
ncbi:MAG: hypothetical protein KJ757_00225, partial [Planctomycetes bacterium]|nr:hypothetical protein [Planctomycetota bacterium]